MQRVREQIEARWQSGSLPEQGVTVAVLDTGIGRHPDLLGRLLAFKDFVHHRNLMYDDNGHGTHVCGIIAGDGRMSQGVYRGMAPASRLVVGKVLDGKGDGTADAMLEGIEWILAVKEQFGIRILNISVGIGNLNHAGKERALRDRLEDLWKEGVMVICAAGNKGPESGSISAIGSGSVLTVGCYDGEYCRDKNRRCENYSGRGVERAPVRKPDLVAPGTDIVSCNVFYRKNNGKIRDAYIKKSGTSMATPIVSGAAALALQKYPGMTNEELKQRLTVTATDLGEPWNLQGWGMVNVKRLMGG